MKRSLLVRAGEALAPDAFLLVLESENDTRSQCTHGNHRNRSLIMITRIRPAQSTCLPSRLLFFLTPYTGLLGSRIFLLVLKKLHFWYLTFFSDFD